MYGESVLFFREKLKIQVLTLMDNIKWDKSTFFQSFSRKFNGSLHILNNSWNTKISTCTHARAEYKEPSTEAIIKKVSEYSCLSQ